jgi:hypothetical protein
MALYKDIFAQKKITVTTVSLYAKNVLQKLLPASTPPPTATPDLFEADLENAP